MSPPLKVAVLAGESTWHYRDLERAAHELGIEICSLEFTRLSQSLKPNHESFTSGIEGVDLRQIHALIVRAMPRGSLEQVVHRMDLLARLEAQGVRILNPPRAIECAVDKYLSLARLAARGFPVPQTCSTECAKIALEQFQQIGGDVIVKPLFGSEGEGLIRLTETQLALRTFRSLENLNSVIYQQEFIQNSGWDSRLFVIGGRVVASMKRCLVEEGAFKTNISQGGKGERWDPPQEVIDLALAASDCLQIPIAGIDVIPDLNGKYHILELNSAPGWKVLSQVSGVDIAKELLTYATKIDHST